MVILTLCNVKEIFNNLSMSVLIYLILFDIFLGIIKAIIHKGLNSHIGLIGLIKHSLIILILIVLGVFTPLLEIEVIFSGMVLFFIVQYLLSITENLMKIGVPLPKFLIDKINDMNEENKKYIQKDETQDRRLDRLENQGDYNETYKETQDSRIQDLENTNERSDKNG